MKPLLLSLALLLISGLYSQSTFYVKTTGSDNNSGNSWSSAFKTVQKALSRAVTGQRIFVAAGSYYPDEGTGATDNNPSNSFYLKSGVPLYGGFAGNETTLEQRNWTQNQTILSGDIDQGAGSQASYHVLQAHGVNSSARLDGFFIMHGHADYLGGGMLNLNSSETIANCTFSSNWAYNGGGMYNDHSPVTIIDCNFSGNVGYYNGGGLFNSYSSASITRCTFASNTAYDSQSGEGAGIENNHSSPEISQCIFTGNSGMVGGAIGSSYCDLVKIYNCLFRNNTAGIGSAVENFTGNAEIYNCTIWGNTNTSISNLSCNSINITNTILHGSIDNFGSNLSVTYSLIPGGYPGTGNINGEARFKNAAGGDFRLDICSPAINTGTNAVVEYQTDLGKRPRIVFGTVDMGAYEMQDLERIIYVNVDATGANNGTSWANAFTRLQDAIARANCSTPTQIWVARGTYYPDEGQGLTDNSPYYSFQLKSGMELYGNFTGIEDSLHKRSLNEYYTSTLSGDIDRDGTSAGNAFHVVKGMNTDTTTIVDGFTITGGNANAASEPDHQYGGGMYLYNASPKIYNCRILSNSARYYGGAVFGRTSYTTFTNSIFWQNQAEEGGAIYNYNWGLVYLRNCSFWGNTASTGGAVRNVSSSMNIVNSILWGDQTEVSNASAYPQIAYSIVQGGYSPGTQILDVDPQYINTAYANLQLFYLSPAIDTGFNTEVRVASDIEGGRRIVGNKVDLGAYEYQGSITQGPYDTLIDPIMLTCPENFNLTANEQSCGALVYYRGEQMAQANWDDGTPNIIYDPPEGTVLPQGENTVTVQATGYVVHPGKPTDTVTASCSFKVFVSDLSSPVISAITVSDPVLYPPNHKMRDVYLNYTVMDNCGVDTVFVQVFSNEKTPDNSASDWEVVNDHQVKLRAERLGTGNGREYGILITAIDHSGNAAVGFATVRVPHDRGNITTRVEPVATDAVGLNVRLLPNPSSTGFNLFTGSASAELMVIRVLDNLGREVDVRKDLPANGSIYFGEKYQPGIYYVQVMQGGEVKVVKVVKM